MDRIRHDAEPDGKTIDGAIELVELQGELLITVATGGSGIESAEDVYRRRDAALRAAMEHWGIEMPYPWRSLGDWHALSSSKFRRWYDRSAHIRNLADRAIQQLETKRITGLIDRIETGTRLLSVGPRIGELRERLGRARTLDDFQDLGRRAREVLIAAVDEVFDPNMVPSNEGGPKHGDAKARFDLILESAFVGSARLETRNFMRAAWDLAMKVTHGGSSERLAGSRQDAVAAVQGALAVVRVLSELTYPGDRTPTNSI